VTTGTHPAMAKERILSVRLGDELAALVDLVAAVQGNTVTDVVKDLLNSHVAGLRDSPEFQREAAAYFDRQRQILRPSNVDRPA
jgi:hypothetical protein